MLNFSLETSGEDCTRSVSEILTGLLADLHRQAGYEDDLAAPFKRAERQGLESTRLG